MSKKTPEPPEMPVTITDKRGSREAKMPTAQELLDTVDHIEEDRQHDVDVSEFERQVAEEAERLAKWEAMSEEEKQELLAQQAAEAGPIPYAGAGVTAEGAEGKPYALAAFVVVVMRDGTAFAHDDLAVIGQYEFDQPATPAMMYRSCADIQKDIVAADTAVLVTQFLKQSAEHAMAQQRAEALKNQLAQRGVRRK